MARLRSAPQLSRAFDRGRVRNAGWSRGDEGAGKLATDVFDMSRFLRGVNSRLPSSRLAERAISRKVAWSTIVCSVVTAGRVVLVAILELSKG